VLKRLFACAAAVRAARAGAVAAEFGLVAPLFLTATLGTIEYGSVFFAYSGMQLGALQASRLVAVHTATPAAVDGLVRQALPEWMRSRAGITVTQSNAARPEQNMINVRVSLPAREAAILPLLTVAVPFTLQVNVTMKQELPYAD
jgi:Flp pilus assembly protein TadG